MNAQNIIIFFIIRSTMANIEFIPSVLNKISLHKVDTNIVTLKAYKWKLNIQE